MPVGGRGSSLDPQKLADADCASSIGDFPPQVLKNRSEFYFITVIVGLFDDGDGRFNLRDDNFPCQRERERLVAAEIILPEPKHDVLRARGCQLPDDFAVDGVERDLDSGKKKLLDGGSGNFDATEEMERFEIGELEFLFVCFLRVIVRLAGDDDTFTGDAEAGILVGDVSDCHIFSQWRI